MQNSYFNLKGSIVEILNIRLDEETFKRERKEVLNMWGADRSVDLDEVIEYHKCLLPDKNYALRVAQAGETGTTLIRTDSGVPTIEEHSEYLRYLQEEGRSDLLGTIVDSLTRHLHFDTAEKGLEESSQTGKWVLNGFPLIAHGIQGTRKVVEAVDLPVKIRGVAPDWRLIAEIGFAGGHSGTASNPLHAFSQFNRNLPLETVIKNHQYMYRLMGFYEDRGIPLLAQITGGFGILCPFSVIIAGAVMDCFIAAEQGVKNISLTLHTQGNLVQDIAAILTLRDLAKDYLYRFGYKGVVVTTNCCSWSGKFPDDVFEASAIISIGVITTVLARGEIAHVKTIEEAKTIPKREANAASLRLGKTIIHMLKDQKFEYDRKAVDVERKVLEKESRAIVDKILEAGEGDAVLGEINGINSGMLDFPFSTSRFIGCRVKGVRDNEGMVRYLDHGRLPLDKESIEYNQEKIAERGSAQGRKVDYQSIIDDLSSISKGLLVGRP